MAIVSTERAGLAQMLGGGAAANFNYDSGTDLRGGLLLLGRWQWFDLDGDPGLPELPRVATTASARLKRDHRAAEGLRTGWAGTIFDSFMVSRNVIEYAVQTMNELSGTSGRDYSGKALADAMRRRGELKFPEFARAMRKLVQARDRLAEVRAELAREAVSVEDESTFATMLQLDSITAPDVESRATTRGEATKAMTAAVFDVAICQSLRPLDDTDHQILIERRALPKSLDDPRVLAAIFRSPRPLIPLSDDELQAAAEMGFAKNWPLTARVAAAANEMIDETRVVAAQAACELGGMLDRERPHEIFNSIESGLWLLEQRALHDEAAAVSLRGGLGLRDPVVVG